MQFNEIIRELRISKGVRQKDVAEYLGLSTKAYNYYELGTREPSIKSIVKLCAYFDVSADYLLGINDL